MLKHERLLGYGGESITFYPGLTDENLVSKFLITNQIGVPSTILNELILNDIDPNGNFHIPIFSYNIIKKVPEEYKEIVKQFIQTLRDIEDYYIWHITMPYGGKSFPQHFDGLNNPKILLESLIPYLEGLVKLSREGYVNEDQHYQNIVINGDKIRMIDNGNINKYTENSALNENFNNFIEMLEINTIVEFNFGINNLRYLVREYKNAKNRWDIVEIYKNWLKTFYT